MNQKLKKIVVRLLFLIILGNFMPIKSIFYTVSIIYITIAKIYDNGNYTINMV